MQIRSAKREPAPPGDIVCGAVAFRERSQCFEITTGIGNETYDIAADRLYTDRQFCDWVWQLHEKGWMTGQKFADFFQCLSEFIYRDRGEWPQDFYAVINAMNVDLDRV
jgi:hypothetical protein